MTNSTQLESITKIYNYDLNIELEPITYSLETLI